jgi:4-alpha-glucanotransferase
MILYFSVDYRTVWGQVICVDGSLPELHEVEMRYKDDGRWQVEVEVPDSVEVFTYSYYLQNSDESIVREWGKPRMFSANNQTKVYHLCDQWMGMPYDSTFFSSAFVHGFFVRERSKEETPKSYVTALTLKVFAPEVVPGRVLAVVGNQAVLGRWNVAKARVMNCAHFPEWEVTIDLSKCKAPLDYKFVVVDPKQMEALQWENGDNRCLSVLPPKGEHSVITNGVFRGNYPTWRAAGVTIPVFALRSERSFGIGDFGDLLKMIDWAAKTGQRIVQLLPVNDTTMTHTWTDSYPYNANSIFALHPLYLDVNTFGSFKNKKTNHHFEILQKQLNALTEVDYEAVSEAKWEFYRKAYKEQGKQVFETENYQQFFSDNSEWLVPYAAFCYLRDTYKTVDFRQWGDYATYDRVKIEALCHDHSKSYDEIAIYYFLQYFLDKQLSEASHYARSKGVVLKGDLAIGISPNSADAWTDPHLFNMDAQTGAPPDDFSFTGQNWGFPTYNWERMRADGFRWWRRRFTKMADYFDAYRIDHLLGFFRIWEIPMDAVQGLLGHFSPALPMSREELQANGFWIDETYHLQPYIRSYQLHDMFGGAVDQVIEQFLIDKGNGVFNLKPEFDTQRKIEHYFNENQGDPDIRDGLYALVADVLFVRDKREKNKFHPRITAQYTYSYRALSDSEKYTFDRIYDHFYYQRHNYFWSEQALQKLPDLIASTDMLVCAEDLGMIPACVPYVMHQLQMLSLEIQRMPKDATLTFSDTRHYPYLSVCTTSTHDMNTLRGWWEESGDIRQRYFNEVLGQWGEAPFYAEPWICKAIVRNHLWAPSMLTILPLQDWLSIDGKMRRINPQEERINVPSNPRHYWRYRMHLTLEQLLKSDALNDQIRTMIVETGR